MSNTVAALLRQLADEVEADPSITHVTWVFGRDDGVAVTGYADPLVHDKYHASVCAIPMLRAGLRAMHKMKKESKCQIVH